eukprot:5950755-Pyramimonas_sp.AAC.1
MAPCHRGSVFLSRPLGHRGRPPWRRDRTTATERLVCVLRPSRELAGGLAPTSCSRHAPESVPTRIWKRILAAA